MTQDETHRLALAVESLRGTVETGFAAVRGDINVLATRESRNASDIEKLDTRVENLESRRFPLPTIGGLCGVAAVLLSVIQVLGKG